MDQRQKENGIEKAGGLRTKKTKQNKKTEKKYLIIFSISNFKVEFDETDHISNN